MNRFLKLSITLCLLNWSQGHASPETVPENEIEKTIVQLLLSQNWEGRRNRKGIPSSTIEDLNGFAKKPELKHLIEEKVTELEVIKILWTGNNMDLNLFKDNTWDNTWDKIKIIQSDENIQKPFSFPLCGAIINLELRNFEVTHENIFPRSLKKLCFENCHIENLRFHKGVSNLERLILGKECTVGQNFMDDLLDILRKKTGYLTFAYRRSLDIPGFDPIEQIQTDDFSISILKYTPQRKKIKRTYSDDFSPSTEKIYSEKALLKLLNIETGSGKCTTCGENSDDESSLSEVNDEDRNTDSCSAHFKLTYEFLKTCCYAQEKRVRKGETHVVFFGRELRECCQLKKFDVNSVIPASKNHGKPVYRATVVEDADLPLFKSILMRELTGSLYPTKRWK